MSDEVTGSRQILPIRAGFVAGTTAFGTLASVALAAVSSAPLRTLVMTAFFAVFFGLVTWLVARRRQERQLAELPVTARLAGHSRPTAFWSGMAYAVLFAFVEVVVIGLCAWLWTLTDVGHFLPGILFGAALSSALNMRDLRRWQSHTGLMVFTREGVRPWAWSTERTRQQLVVVPHGPTYADAS